MRILALIPFLFIIWPVCAAEYLLGPGDKIKISVYDEPDLTVEKTIDRTGVISFPFIEDVKVSQVTTNEVEKKIREGLLGDYLVDPQVTVTVVQYRPFFIHGQVVRPGGYAYQDDLRLDKAIALAGGLASRASKTNWKITRIVDNKTVTIEANISTIILPDDIIKIEQSFF
jgi:polysaccharide biosynthesis/export protein VpsN